MGFSRQEYWNDLPFPTPGHLPDPGIEPRSPALLADSSLPEIPGMGFQSGASVKNPPANVEDIKDTGSVPQSGRSPGGGHGNPLQYSCLKSPMDTGAWWVTVHRSQRPGQDRSGLARSKPIALQNVVHSAGCWIKCKTGLIFLSREGCFQAALLGTEQQACLILDTFASLVARHCGCECECVCV